MSVYKGVSAEWGSEGWNGVLGVQPLRQVSGDRLRQECTVRIRPSNRRIFNAFAIGSSIYVYALVVNLCERVRKSRKLHSDDDVPFKEPRCRLRGSSSARFSLCASPSDHVRHLGHPWDEGGRRYRRRPRGSAQNSSNRILGLRRVHTC